MRYVVPSFLETFQGICAFYLNLIESDLGTEGFERVAGILFASIVAYHLKKPFLYVPLAWWRL